MNDLGQEYIALRVHQAHVNEMAQLAENRRHLDELRTEVERRVRRVMRINNNDAR